MKDIDLLSIVIQTPGALTPIVWGPPGIGKSARMRQLAAALKLSLETVIASIRDPSDFGGLPVPENGHGVRLEPPSWAIRLAKEGKGIVFLDEASCAPPAVQAALLRPVLEGCVGDLALPAGVRWVAAANPPDQAAGGWDLSPPMANRFVHLTWSAPAAGEWIDWLTGGDADASFPILDLEEWARQFGQAKSLASAFLHRRPGLLSEDTTKIRGRFPLAYATPRSWECAIRLLASCRALGLSEATLPLLAGALGEPISVEFAAWLRSNDLPDPEKLLADPASWTPSEKHPDRAFAVCLSVTDAALTPQSNGKAEGKEGKKDAAADKKKLHARWHSAWRVLERALPIGKDIVAIAARRLADPKHRPEGGLIEVDVKKVIGQLREVVAAAGIN